MSVEVAHLSKYYNGKAAIENLSFSVSKGQILGFLGSNGAGKTTTMKILSCYVPQSSGEAAVCGFDVRSSPDEVKKRIGYLPEHNPLYKHMYIREFLHLIAGIHGVNNKKNRVESLIERIGLTPELGKQIGELSKGFRQRVGLAQALIHDPEVLILDEPTSGFDPVQLHDMRKLIKSLGREKTIIFSSHIMQEIEAVCDRVIIIHKGRIKYEGDLGSMNTELNKIQVQFNKKVARKSLESLDAAESVQMGQENLFQIETANADKLKKELFLLGQEKNAYFKELKSEAFNLEDLFLKYTKDEVE